MFLSGNSSSAPSICLISLPPSKVCRMKYVLALAAMAASLVSGKYTRCATPNPSEEHMAVLNAAAEEGANRTLNTFSAQAVRNVDTYVHVVTTTAKKGKYSQTMINKQVSTSRDSIDIDH